MSATPYIRAVLVRWDARRWPDFSVAEISCPCCGETVIDPSALDCLQRLRNAMGTRIRINSGHRCVQHNKQVGGAPKSRHLGGGAFDIAVAGHDRRTLYANAKAAGFAGFGFMLNALHCDTRATPAAWNYGPESEAAWTGVIPPGTHAFTPA
jgi:hypothetical protein